MISQLSKKNWPQEDEVYGVSIILVIYLLGKINKKICWTVWKNKQTFRVKIERFGVPRKTNKQTNKHWRWCYPPPPPTSIDEGYWNNFIFCKRCMVQFLTMEIFIQMMLHHPRKLDFKFKTILRDLLISAPSIYIFLWYIYIKNRKYLVNMKAIGVVVTTQSAITFPLPGSR